MKIDERIDAIAHLDCPGHVLPSPKYQCEDDIKQLISDVLDEITPIPMKFAYEAASDWSMPWNDAIDQMQAKRKRLGV